MTDIVDQHIDPAWKRRVYGTALRIRLVEDVVADAHHAWKIQTPTHLCHGQEGLAAALGACLQPADQLFAYYRSHGWYLAKGGDLRAMMAELFGKATGCSRGFGGSMHLIDLAVGHQGTTSTVAGGIPHAVGAAFAIKYRGLPGLAVSCFGDGATEEGVFQESLMFAALRRLPIVFVCDNNGMACEVPIAHRQPPAAPIWERARAFGVAATRVDGRDDIAVCGALRHAVDRARRGEGPYFVECFTRRFAAHCEIPGVAPLHRANNTPEDDPIARMRAWVSDDDRQALTGAIQAEIEDAMAFALSSPFPADIHPWGASPPKGIGHVEA